MNIKSTSRTAATAVAKAAKPKTDTKTIEVSVPSTQGMLEATESFVSGRGGSTLLHGLGGLLPGVGVATGVSALEKLHRSDAATRTPAVASGLKFATGVGMVASGFAALSIMDAFMTNREAFGPWTTGAVLLSGATSALGAFVANTDFQS